MSEETLPSRQLEIDGLIVGYLRTPNSIGTVTNYFPIIRAIKYSDNEQSPLDLAAPLQHEVEPDQSISVSGITLTLDRIEYRSKLARVCFTVDNESEFPMYLYNVNIRSNGQEIGGTLAINQYIPPVQIRQYLADEEVLPSLLLNPGDSNSVILGTTSITAEDPVEIFLEYEPLDYSKPPSPDSEDHKHIELRLVYPPDEDEEESESGRSRNYEDKKRQNQNHRSRIAGLCITIRHFLC